MKQWEYCSVEGYEAANKTLGDWNAALARELNKLGEQGWELVAIDRGLFIFKREKTA